MSKENNMSKDQLLQTFADAYEQVIVAANSATQRGTTRRSGEWGPREIVAHMAGWEVMASVHIPHIVAGMPPAFNATSEEQQTVMNNAINAALVALAGDQSLETLCGILRRAYQRTIEILRQLDEPSFQPGQYAYERTRDAIEHCKEHREQLELL